MSENLNENRISQGVSEAVVEEPSDVLSRSMLLDGDPEVNMTSASTFDFAPPLSFQKFLTMQVRIGSNRDENGKRYNVY